jgi:hypothetical protein
MEASDVFALRDKIAVADWMVRDKRPESPMIGAAAVMAIAGDEQLRAAAEITRAVTALDINTRRLMVTSIVVGIVATLASIAAVVIAAVK